MQDLQALIDEQIEREKRTSAIAQSKAFLELSEAAQQGRLEGLPASTRVIARMYNDMHKALELVVNKTNRGPGAAQRGWLRSLDAATLSVITIRHVMSTCLRTRDRGATVQQLAINLGRKIVREVLVRRAEEVSPVYVKRTLAYLKDAGTVAQHHVERTMDRVILHVLELDAQEQMQHSDLLHMGKHCVQAALAIGLLHQRRGVSSKGKLVTYHLDQTVQDVLTKSYPGMVSTSRIASVCPPKRWVSAFGGGYQTRAMSEPLIGLKYGNRVSTKRKVVQNVEENTRLLDCINYLQNVQYHVHPGATDTLIRVWDEGGAVLGMPNRNAPSKPTFPFGDDWDKGSASEEELKVFSEWKRLVAAWHTHDKKRQSKLHENNGIIRSARELRDRKVWFPVFGDFRQRLYYGGDPNPQGGDAARSLVHFGRKKPLGERGLYWLKVHIANSCGFDKARFDLRVKWVEDNWEALQEGAEYPENSDLYRGIGDNPLVAAAAVRELKAAYACADPTKYETGIPVHMDASCSAYQHLAAMLRDPVGAKYSNLIDPGGDVKADIYGRVAEVAMQQILQDAKDAGHQYQICAKLWAEHGVSRDLTKPPVMTLPYGATLRGAVDDIRNYLDDEGWTHETVSTSSMGQYLGRVLFDAIEATVPAAAECMRWLRARCRAGAKQEAMLWLNPMGFLVSLDIREMQEHRVFIRSCGLAVTVVREYGENNAGQRIGNSISPNFVHSLDAAHLCMTAEKMRDAGLDMVTIHDSFGTHPSDVDDLHRFTREAFVEMYSGESPLQMFLDGIGQEAELPTMGNFELQHVMESEFFFC